MITVRKTFNIQVANAPFEFSLVPSGDCASVSVVSTSSTQVVVDITWTSEACISTTTFTANVVDSAGCILTTPVTIDSPCDTFSVTDISVDSLFNMSVVASGGVAPYTYQWKVDTSVFKVNALTNATLVTEELLTTPASTTIYCTVTDAAGCTETKSLEYTFCKPLASNITVTMNQIYESVPTCPAACTRGVQRIVDAVTPCSGAIDYTRTVLNVNNTSVCASIDEDGILTVYAANTVSGTASFTYYVVDEYGVQSDPATITLIIPECSITGTPAYVAAYSEIQRVGISGTTGDVIEFNVADRMQSNSDIDWGTFEFLNTPSMGTVTLEVPGVIEYTITASPPLTGADPIIWYVENEDGAGSGAIADVVVFDINPAPVAVADTVCIACGDTSDETDILANDTGDIDRNSVQFVSIDPDIQVTGSKGTYRFKAGYGASLSNLVQYKVSNKEGVESNTSYVLVRSVCAGVLSQSIIDATCTPEVDLGDYLTQHNSFTYTVTEPDAAELDSYTTQGGVIDTSFPCTFGCLDFTAISAGDYGFAITAESQAPCTNTDVIEVTVRKLSVPYPVNDLCAGAINIPYSNSMYVSSTNADLCPKQYAPTDSGVAVPSRWTTPMSGDLWFTFTPNDASNLTPYIYVESITMTNPQIALYDGTCAALNELANDAVTGSNLVMLDASNYTTLVLGTQYWIRVSCPDGDEGTFRVIVTKTAIA